MAVAVAWLIVGGCAATSTRGPAALAAHATRDGFALQTAVRFAPVRGGPLVFVMAESAWLHGHAYARMEGVPARTVLVPGSPATFLHAWAVRDAGGRALTIYFDMSQMVPQPTPGGHLPPVLPATATPD